MISIALALALVATAVALPVTSGAAPAQHAAAAKKKPKKHKKHKTKHHKKHRKLPPTFIGMLAQDFNTYSGTPAYRRKQLKGMSKLGVHILRATFDVHANPAALDAYVLDAARRKIEVLPFLFDGSRFADTEGPTRGFSPPADFAEFASAAQRLVLRYGPKGTLWTGKNAKLRKYAIHTWQIWNEPNLPVYWQPKPDPKGYVQLVKAAAGAIHAADKHAKILSAGLPDSKQSKPRNYKAYLKAFLKAGGWKYVDMVGLQNYQPTTASYRRVITTYRKLLNANHGRKLKILITELGWADKGHKNVQVVGRKGQAKRITETYKLIGNLQAKDKIAGVMYFAWRDYKIPKGDPRGNTWGYHTGLVTVKGKHKPAYAAFKRAAHKLRTGR